VTAGCCPWSAEFGSVQLSFKEITQRLTLAVAGLPSCIAGRIRSGWRDPSAGAASRCHFEAVRSQAAIPGAQGARFNFRLRVVRRWRARWKIQSVSSVQDARSASGVIPSSLFGEGCRPKASCQAGVAKGFHQATSTEGHLATNDEGMVRLNGLAPDQGPATFTWDGFAWQVHRTSIRPHPCTTTRWPAQA